MYSFKDSSHYVFLTMCDRDPVIESIGSVVIGMPVVCACGMLNVH